VNKGIDLTLDGEVRFEPGKGLEELQKMWPSVRVKNLQKVNAGTQPKTPSN
jgi:hypothetical protein